jgi:hypothetical protein
MKAGITGWAQVCGRRGDPSLEHRVERDLYSIEHWSIWLDLKNMPGLLLWLLLPLHVALNLVSIVWFALRGQGGVILRAKRDALLGLPKMWRKRQAIQSARVATVREIWRVLDKHIVPAR